MPLIKRRTKTTRAPRGSRIDQRLLAVTIEDARERLPAFALILEGNALAPHYLDGDLLTVCPNATPAPGEAVVALVRGQYVCMLINADNDLYANHGEFIQQGSYTVAGV
ncbi:MAG: S24 family peptidase, partial [Armatimonadota bacterium]